MHKKHRDENFLSGLVQNGIEHVSKQNELLNCMFLGSPTIVFDNVIYSYEKMLAIVWKCDLKEYVHNTSVGLNAEYSTSIGEIKAYINCLAALEDLIERGLVEKKFENAVRNKITNPTLLEYMNDIVELGQILYELSTKGKAQVPYKNKEIDLGRAIYSLTEKGYDVALTLQQHADHQQQFSEQKKLTEKVVDASSSSARTARRALWAATAIAVGSLGHLVAVILYKSF